MARQRDDDGMYIAETTNSDIIAAVKSTDGPAATTPEIAAACECSTETVRRRLRELADIGRVDHKTTGQVTLWWVV